MRSATASPRFIATRVGHSLIIALCPAVLGGCAGDPPQRSLTRTIQSTSTTAEFRGMSAAGPRIVWASGRNATFARTVDGGDTWTSDTVPGAGDLFFIDVHAVDENVAVLLGTDFDGGLARIFTTHDGGRRWTQRYMREARGVFFDGMALWSAERGVAFSDPVDGSFLVVTTRDGGATWSEVPPANLPPPLPGEAGFAASGTAITVAADGHAWFGTGGGPVGRVYRSSDWGQTWSVSETPIAGSSTSGIFGITFWDPLNGVAVGGDYTAPRDTSGNVIRTRDGGRTWHLLGSSAPAGVRYGVAHVPGSPGPTLIAVGPSGLGWSRDAGATWQAIDTAGYNAVSVPGGPNLIWVAGTEGRVARLLLGER